MNEPAVPDQSPHLAPTPPRKRRWRRRLKILGGFVVVIVAFVSLLPTLLSLSVFKTAAEKALSESLGVPVAVESYRLGWAGGVRIDGVTVAQPSGFPSDRPLLTLQSASLDIGWLGLLRGDVDIAGEVRGLSMLVYQRKDGSVNFEGLGGGDSPASHDSSGGTDRSSGGTDRTVHVEANTTLERLRVNLALRDITIDVVHEERGVIESVRRLEGTIDKRAGSTDFKFQMSAELAGPDASKPPGKLQMDADVDGSMQRPLEFQITSAGFDFARYRPLVDAIVGHDALAALDGVLDGTVKVRVENLETAFVTGALTVTNPHIAGTFVQGMDVQAKRWVINPNLQFALGSSDAAKTTDLSGFSVDLGVVKLRGVPRAEANAAFASNVALAGRGAIGIDFDVDLQALGQFGGPIPAMLKEQAGTVRGRATLAMPAGGEAPADVMKFITAALMLDATVEVPVLALGVDTSLGALVLRASMVGGKVKATLAPGATVNGGAFALDADLDLTQATWPTTLTLGVTEGQLTGAAVQLLQYAVPLFAGLAQQQHVQLDGKGTLAVQLGGPAKMAAEESWLQWLNRWSGNGKVALAEGSVMPAPPFAGLMQWLEPAGGGKFAFDSIATDFTLRQGAVDTGLVKLDGKAKKLQLTGSTNLDGRLDHRFDMLGLLAGHKDGDKVLAHLQGQRLGASIVGTLASPQVDLPDMQKVLLDAARAAAEAEVKKQADDLLKKGLDSLFKRKD